MARVILEKRIKKRRQLEMARLQDVLVDFVVSLSKPAVFHEGTAIWRVYKGRRFSEDLDFYYVWDDAGLLKDDLERFLEPFNARIVKFKTTQNTLFADIERDRVRVKLEFANRNKDGIIGGYERVDGSFVSVYVLSPEDLFYEKVDAYLSRFMVRDLYDILFLYPLCDKGKILPAIRRLQSDIDRPKDEEVLRTIVIDGIIPTYEQMKKTVMRW